MNEYARKPGYDCPPLPEHPAQQPRAPRDDCEKPPTTSPPEAKPPEPCCVSDCNCPTAPGPTKSCLENLITARKGQITRGDKAKAYVTELQTFQTKAIAASQN